MTRKIIQLECFTDGSCLANGSAISYGGWSYLIHRDNRILFKDSGSELGTTNQRMELLAAAEALDKISILRSEFEEVILYSDSSYLINCWIQGWWEKWVNNNWKNSKNQSVANQDLWWRLIPYFEKQHYSFQHVKGHADSVYNNMADKMATTAADKLKTEDIEKARKRGIRIPDPNKTPYY